MKDVCDTILYFSLCVDRTQKFTSLFLAGRASKLEFVGVMRHGGGRHSLRFALDEEEIALQLTTLLTIMLISLIDLAVLLIL